MSDRPRIVLVRHGRPHLPADLGRAMSGRDIGRWYRGYDGAGIAHHSEPPVDLRAAAAAAGCVVASDTRRARESAARLTGAERVRIEPVLREVGFPEAIAVDLRLSPGVWVMLARGLQLVRRGSGDGSAGDEAVPATRVRAALAVETLSVLADEHQSLVVVGHGWFNQFLARELRRRGWTGPRWMPTGYWSSATFHRRARRSVQ